MGLSEYFERFFEEKNLAFVIWEIEASDGIVHVINNEVVIEAIKGANTHERKAIRDMLVRLDFHNADINDYLKHLAKGLVETRVAS